MELKYLDKVKVIGGFYEGQEGVVESQTNLYEYGVIIHKGHGRETTVLIHEDNLEKQVV